MQNITYNKVFFVIFAAVALTRCGSGQLTNATGGDTVAVSAGGTGTSGGGGGGSVTPTPSPTPSPSPTTTTTTTTTTKPSNTINGILQSGTGWTGNVNVASTSAQYEALSLDEIEAKNSPMAQTLKQFPAVEAAIRQVSQETGVPDGLLAGVCYQESTFSVSATSGNPDPTPQDSEDVGLTQAPSTDFSGNTWQDPVTNIRDFATKYFLPGYQQSHSWGVALREWNSGTPENLQDLSQENNGTDPDYVTRILTQHCMGLD